MFVSKSIFIATKTSGHMLFVSENIIDNNMVDNISILPVLLDYRSTVLRLITIFIVN